MNDNLEFVHGLLLAHRFGVKMGWEGVHDVTTFECSILVGVGVEQKSINIQARGFE